MQLCKLCGKNELKRYAKKYCRECLPLSKRIIARKFSYKMNNKCKVCKKKIVNESTFCKRCWGKNTIISLRKSLINHGKVQSNIINELSQKGFMLITSEPCKIRMALRKLKYNNYFKQDIRTYQKRIGINGVKSIFLIYFKDKEDVALNALLEKIPEIQYHPQKFHIYKKDDKL